MVRMKQSVPWWQFTEISVLPQKQIRKVPDWWTKVVWQGHFVLSWPHGTLGINMKHQNLWFKHCLSVGTLCENNHSQFLAFLRFPLEWVHWDVQTDILRSIKERGCFSERYQALFRTTLVIDLNRTQISLSFLMEILKSQKLTMVVFTIRAPIIVITKNLWRRKCVRRGYFGP